jgi:Ca2+-binding EF-hand superfamily protein
MARTHRMKTHTKIVLGALAVAAAIGGTAAAVQADSRGHYGKSDRGEWLFERYDANQDGKITKDEITAARKASLTKYDADKDGQLSLDEFQGLFNEIMRYRMVRMFQKLDRDGDAKVSEAEIARRVDRMMARLDRDDNGEIDRNDLKRHHMGHDRDDDRGHHGDKH